MYNQKKASWNHEIASLQHKTFCVLDSWMWWIYYEFPLGKLPFFLVITTYNTKYHVPAEKIIKYLWTQWSKSLEPFLSDIDHSHDWETKINIRTTNESTLGDTIYNFIPMQRSGCMLQVNLVSSFMILSSSFKLQTLS